MPPEPEERDVDEEHRLPAHLGKPALALERQLELADARRRRHVQDLDRAGSDDSVGLEIVAALEALHRIDESALVDRRPVGGGLRRGGAGGQVAEGAQSRRQRRDAGPGFSRRDLLLSLREGRDGGRLRGGQRPVVAERLDHAHIDRELGLGGVQGGGQAGTVARGAKLGGEVEPFRCDVVVETDQARIHAAPVNRLEEARRGHRDRHVEEGAIRRGRRRAGRLHRGPLLRQLRGVVVGRHQTDFVATGDGLQGRLQGRARLLAVEPEEPARLGGVQRFQVGQPSRHLRPREPRMPARVEHSLNRGLSFRGPGARGHAAPEARGGDRGRETQSQTEPRSANASLPPDRSRHGSDSFRRVRAGPSPTARAAGFKTARTSPARPH